MSRSPYDREPDTEVDWGLARCIPEADLFEAANTLKGKAGSVAREAAKDECLKCYIGAECFAENVRLGDTNQIRAGLTPREWRVFFKKHPKKDIA